MGSLRTKGHLISYVNTQVIISLSGGEIIYFQLSAAGQLLETEKRDMSGDLACLDVGPVPEGRQRSRFLAAASYDSTVCYGSSEGHLCCLVVGKDSPELLEALYFICVLFYALCMGNA